MAFDSCAAFFRDEELRAPLFHNAEFYSSILTIISFPAGVYSTKAWTALEDY
jgi:hypothetical protein